MRWDMKHGKSKVGMMGRDKCVHSWVLYAVVRIVYETYVSSLDSQ